MTAELPKPEAWIGNDPTIVDLITSNFICLSSVTSPEIGIGILVYGGLFSEWFRESFRTFAILHARSSWIVGIAGSVNHVLLDQLKQLWLRLLIWKLG